MRKTLLDLRQNPEKALEHKTMILEMVQREDEGERNRAIAMAIIADHQWVEGLPFAKKIVVESSSYSGLQQAAIRAVGVLGQDKYDLAFLDDLLQGLEKMNAKSSLGVLRSLAETLAKARDVMAKRLNLEEDVTYKKGGCCPPEQQKNWRRELIRGSERLEETLIGMQTFLEERDCRRPLHQVYMLLAQVHLLQGINRKGQYTQQQAQSEFLKVTDRTLQVIDDCGERS